MQERTEWYKPKRKNWKFKLAEKEKELRPPPRRKRLSPEDQQPPLPGGLG